MIGHGFRYASGVASARRYRRKHQAASFLLAAIFILMTYAISGFQRVWANDMRQSQVTLHITKGNKTACIQLWWIVPATVGIRDIGKVCGSATLRSPSYFGIRLPSILVARREAGKQIDISGFN